MSHCPVVVVAKLKIVACPALEERRVGSVEREERGVGSVEGEAPYFLQEKDFRKLISLRRKTRKKIARNKSFQVTLQDQEHNNILPSKWKVRICSSPVVLQIRIRPDPNILPDPDTTIDL